MQNIKQLLRQRLLAILRLFSTYKTARHLPAGTVTYDELDSDSVLYMLDEEPEKRKLPVTIGEIHESFKNRLASASWKTFVVQEKNWKVWGNQGAVLTNNNFLFSDVSREFDDETHSVFRQFKLIEPSCFKGSAAVLAASGASVYYHWMFDILPRINILKSSGKFESTDKFIINFQSVMFQTETLRRAGIAHEKIIASNDHWNFHLQAEQLLVPSLASPNDIPSRAACKYLRSLFIDEIKDPDKKKRIYVQRLHGRKVINEDELLPLLSDLGVETVHPEKLTVAEQASLFAGADMVVGPHGAGLTNIVFCKPGTIVIDLFAPEWVNPCYWVIAEHLNLTYSYLIGREIKEQKERSKGADIRVDIDQLKTLLAKLDIKVPATPGKSQSAV